MGIYCLAYPAASTNPLHNSLDYCLDLREAYRLQNGVCACASACVCGRASVRVCAFACAHSFVCARVRV